MSDRPRVRSVRVRNAGTSQVERLQPVRDDVARRIEALARAPGAPPERTAHPTA